MSTQAEPGRRSASARALSLAQEYAGTLVLGAAGAGLVLLAARQGWDRVVTGGPAPLPSARVPVTGESLVPVAAALALASLAGLAAVVATRRRVRRGVGVLLAVFGIGMAVALTLPISPGDVRAAAAAAGSVQGGSATSGAPSGAVPGGLGTALAGHAGYVTATDSLWRPLAVAGALVVILAGILVAWRGGRWASMSSRYSRTGTSGSGTSGSGTSGSGASGEAPRGASADMWESLTMGVDPTEPDTPDAAVSGRPGGAGE